MESADISITLFDTQQWKVMTSALSIVVRQTMACRRHHFPLLCVKQCNADVSMPLFDAQQWKCKSLHT